MLERRVMLDSESFIMRMERGLGEVKMEMKLYDNRHGRICSRQGGI